MPGRVPRHLAGEGHQGAVGVVELGGVWLGGDRPHRRFVPAGVTEELRVGDGAVGRPQGLRCCDCDELVAATIHALVGPRH